MKVKALHIAAYLLIAHFLAILGLALVAQGTPNYSRLGFTLLLLVVACAALFTPRKRGWMAVVGYAVIVLAQHAMALWPAWSNPSVPMSAKVTAVIMLAVTPWSLQRLYWCSSPQALQRLPRRHWLPPRLRRPGSTAELRQVPGFARL
jgi:hypothetical protein